MKRLYKIDRTLGFTLKQGFVALASDAEEAEENVAAFVNSGWSDAEGQRLGVVQVSDELEQDDNGEEFCRNAEPLDGTKTGMDDSLRNLCLENRAQGMYALLVRIAAEVAATHAVPQHLAEEACTFVADIEAAIAAPKVALSRLTG